MAITLTDQQIAVAAAVHEAARVDVSAIGRITLTHPDMTIDDAYAIQQAGIELRVAAGAEIIGHKIGLTSRAMQQAMNIDEPDFGMLLDTMVIESGAQLRTADYLDPRIEVELAFVLGDAITAAEPSVADVLAATAYVVPALELIDARSHRIDPADGVTRGVRDTISDNAANAGIVCGSARIRPGDVDLRWVPAILECNGVVEETGVAAGVLGDPVLGIVWLVRRLRDFGVSLTPGQVVLAGSFTRPVPCRPGDHLRADFGTFGTIGLDFV